MDGFKLAVLRLLLDTEGAFSVANALAILLREKAAMYRGLNDQRTAADFTRRADHISASLTYF